MFSSRGTWLLPEGMGVDDGEAAPIAAFHDSVGNDDFSEVRNALDLHSIPGVQDKVSPQMISVPVSDNFSHSILKLNPADYPGLVENEFAHLEAARKLGLPVAKARMVRDKSGESGWAGAAFGLRRRHANFGSHASPKIQHDFGADCGCHG